MQVPSIDAHFMASELRGHEMRDGEERRRRARRGGGGEEIGQKQGERERGAQHGERVTQGVSRGTLLVTSLYSTR